MKPEKMEKWEIRCILLGKTLVSDDGQLTAKEPGVHIVPQGVVDGAAAVRFLGISRKDFAYETGLKEAALLAAAKKTMQDMGRGVCLREHSGTPACLIRYALTGPTVLHFQYAEGIPTLTVWTARGLMGIITRSRAVSSFERALSNDIRPVQRPEPPKAKNGKRGQKNRPVPDNGREKASGEDRAEHS